MSIIPRPDLPQIRLPELEDVTIRYAFPEDARALRRLATLDSQRVRHDVQLVAEVQGELRAALTEDGTAIADPFHHTADLILLLRERARQLEAATSHGARSSRLRRLQRLLGDA
jgi:hypothetical protein